ncbi:MAG: hypothetical protein K2N28_00010 [Muribaculaceae bacterium]|nr:hypothetical protein [Muribaculaceae bacterium]
MKSIFSKLKSSIDGLTGSPERTLNMAKEALTKLDGVYFREDNGVLRSKIDATDTFNRNLIRKLIPDKKSLTLEIIIDTIPDNDYADMAAKYDFGTPLLKGGAKDGLPCVTATLEGDLLKNPERLADAIKTTLEAVDTAIDDFAASLDISLVKPTPSAIRDALKSRSDLDVSNVLPLKHSAQPTGVFVTVKVNEFKYYKLRLACSEGCIYPTFYITNIDAEKAIQIFSDNNLKAIRLEDGSVKVYGEFDEEGFSTIKIFSANLTAYIDSLTKSLKQINEIIPLGDAQLHNKVFDCWGIEEVLLERKDFKNYKQNGVVTLNTPEGTDGFKFAINTTVTVLPLKVTICSIIDAGLKPDSSAEKIIADFNKKPIEIKAEITSGGSLKVQGIEEASTYYDNLGIAQYGVKNVIELFNKVNDTLLDLLNKLGVETRVFILDDVRHTLKNIPGFEKIDDDGDVYFKFNPNEHFSHKRFVWVYIKPDKLRFDAGICNFKTEMPLEEALEKVKAAFKDNNDGISYRISGKTNIRAEKSIYRKDLSDNNLRSQIKQEAENIIKELNDRMVKVAEICGIPAFVFNVDNFGKACLKAELTKVNDSNCVYEWTFGTMCLTKENRIRIEIKREFKGEYYDLKDSFERALKQLDKRLEKIAYYSSTTDLHFSLLNYNTFEDLVSDLKNLRKVANKADDIIIEYNKKADAIAEEKRRREREAKEKAQLERELNSSYWMDIDYDTNVRWICKTFNEWYPYLRLGIFMVKTGQGADRFGDTISSYDINTTMRQIRSFKGGGRVTIYGRSTPADVEKEFRSKLGLVVKVCYTDPNKHRYYISKDNYLHKKSLVEIERQFKKEGGYYYNDWY